MPDNISGLRPVVRRVSATQKDLINRFERSTISGSSNPSSVSSSVSSSSSNTPSSLVSRSRAGSVKKTSPVSKTGKAEDSKTATKTTTTTSKDTTVVRRTKTSKELQREEHIIDFIEKVLHERPRGDFEGWVRDAVILSKLMTAIVFNSVPKEDIEENWGSDAARLRARELIREMMRYGVRDSFRPEDLTEMKDVYKVTKCVEELVTLSSKDKDSLINVPPPPPTETAQ